MIRRTLRSRGFTLVELLVVICIIGLLASMVIPEMSRVIDRSQSVACMGNLRQIGVAVLSYAADNEGKYPFIEPNANSPVYPKGEEQVEPLWVELADYGLTGKVLKCPSDKTYFSSRGSSYQWRPIIDGETTINPVIYSRRGAFSVNPSRITICTDYESVHFNRPNRLRGDGSVSFKLK